MNQSKPSIYVYGMAISGLNPTIYGGLFGNATRAVGLAINLAKLGHEIYLEVENNFNSNLKSEELPVSLKLIRESQRQDFLCNADVLLISCTNIQSFHKLFGRDPYLDHPCKIIASCFDLKQSIDLERLRGKVKFITFNNSKQKRMWDGRKNSIPSLEIPYGVNETVQVDDAIIDVQKPSALWMGAIRRTDMLQRIVHFARVNTNCKVTVVTRAITDNTIESHKRGGLDNPYADFTGRDSLKVFDEIVEELCGIKTPSNIDFLGPMEGQNHIIQGQHTIGLDFSRFPSQSHDNTKILDYLRSGLCVICDKGTPSYRFVEETGNGAVVSPNFDDNEIRNAYECCLKIGTLENRKSVAAFVRKKYGWDTLALIYSELACKATRPTKVTLAKRAVRWIRRTKP